MQHTRTDWNVLTSFMQATVRHLDVSSAPLEHAASRSSTPDKIISAGIIVIKVRQDELLCTYGISAGSNAYC